MDIGVHGTCIVNNCLWFSLEQGNGLCKMDMDTKRYKYVTSIPKENMYETCLYADIKRYEQKLILVPMNAKEIAVYDMDTERISKVPVFMENLKYKEAYDGRGKFHSAIIVDEWIYMIPCFFPAIIKMNIKTCEIVYFEDWIGNILPYRHTNRLYFREDIVKDEKGMIYLTSLYYNTILSVDTKLDKIDVVRQGEPGGGCSCINYQNNFVLFNMNQRRILLFDKYWKIKQEIKSPNTVSETYQLDYIKSVLWGNYIFFIPFGANMMLRLDIITNNLSAVRQWNIEDVPRYVRSWRYQNKLYCYRDYILDIYNMEGCLIDSVLTKGTEDFWNDMMLECFNQGKIIEETEAVHLAEYLKFLGRAKLRSDINNIVSCGGAIYSRIMNY